MKKVIIVAIIGVVIFIVVSLLMNKFTNIIRDSVENDTKKANNKIEKKYEINTIFSDYKLDSYDDWYDYIKYIEENYVDEKLRGYADIVQLVHSYESIDISDNETSFVLRNTELSSKEYYTGQLVKNSILYRAHIDILNILLQHNCDWTDLPLTENFRNKFNEKEGILNYYGLSDGLIDRGEIEGLFSIFIADNLPKDYESIEYRFVCIFNEDGYFDNIYYLGRLMEEPIYDGDEIPFVYEMNDVDYINWCVHEICVSEEYLMKGGDALTDFDTHISGMNNFSINYKYRDKIFNSNGILPIKDYIKDSLEVMSYDEALEEAVVKIETEDKRVYYKIKLDIDENYRLENASVELFKEEDK